VVRARKVVLRNEAHQGRSAEYSGRQGQLFGPSCSLTNTLSHTRVAAVLVDEFDPRPDVSLSASSARRIYARNGSMSPPLPLAASIDLGSFCQNRFTDENRILFLDTGPAFCNCQAHAEFS
jgi:hypothetical protein